MGLCLKVSPIYKTITKMAKSAEYTTIYKDAGDLRYLLGKVLLMMTKANRIEVGSRVYANCGELIQCFVMAYEYEDERMRYMRKLEAIFHLLVIDIRIICNNGLLISPHPDTKEKPHVISLLITEKIAAIDKGIQRWKATTLLAQGKTGAAKTSAAPEE